MNLHIGKVSLHLHSAPLHYRFPMPSFRRRPPKDRPLNVGSQRLTASPAIRGKLNKRALLGRDRPDAGAPLLDGGGRDAKKSGHPNAAANVLASRLEGFVRGDLLHTKAESKVSLDQSKALAMEAPYPQSGDMPKDSREMARLLDEAMGEDRGINKRLADACKVSIQAVGQWRKTGRVNKKHLPVIAHQLGKPLTYFFPESAEEAKPLTAAEPDPHPGREMERQLLMLFRAIGPDKKHELLRQANKLYNEEYSGSHQGNPYPMKPGPLTLVAPPKPRTKK